MLLQRFIRWIERVRCLCYYVLFDNSENMICLVPGTIAEFDVLKLYMSETYVFAQLHDYAFACRSCG